LFAPSLTDFYGKVAQNRGAGIACTIINNDAHKTDCMINMDGKSNVQTHSRYPLYSSDARRTD
ncbi:hypothetical protein, partial [Enterobacter hormaechei]|uniref:hypothetical protein n=1 Tax=Enterobacter hormaechei TaxID=158836 RepID=UPI0023F6B821